MKRIFSLAACVVASVLSQAVPVHGHAGHDHGAAPGAEAAAPGPVTLSEEAVKNLGIETMEANIVPLQRTLELVGRIQSLPEKQAKISPNVGGRVSEILVKLGDQVKAGQPVLRFQPLTVGNPSVVLNSPIAGYVSRQEVSIGQALTPETMVMEIADYNQVLARAFMFEGPEMSLIKPGQSGRVRLDAFPGEVFEGKVQRLDVGLEAESRTFEAYVLLDNSELKLRPNMLATVVLGLGEPQDVLAVPRRALLGDLGNLFVFVQDGNTFERRNVVLGMKAGDQVEVMEGVLPGDKVVVQGNYQLQFASGRKPAAPDQSTESTAKGATQPAVDDGHSHASAAGNAGVLPRILALVSKESLPVWVWSALGFVLGGFVFGFLFRRTA